MARHAAQYEEIRQDVDHVRRLQLPIDADRQALSGELVDDGCRMRSFMPLCVRSSTKS